MLDLQGCPGFLGNDFGMWIIREKTRIAISFPSFLLRVFVKEFTFAGCGRETA